MARYRALTDLTLPNGLYVQAGSEFDAPPGYRPPTHACDPLDPDAVEAYWNEGPRLSDVEIWRAVFTNSARWVGVPVKPPTTWWVKVDGGYVLHGVGGNYGVHPPA